LRAKRHGLLEYARLGSEYTGDFDRKWLREARPAEETLLGTADIQSLADLSNSCCGSRRRATAGWSRDRQPAVKVKDADRPPTLPHPALGPTRPSRGD
jgi:hypothetical protein